MTPTLSEAAASLLSWLGQQSLWAAVVGLPVLLVARSLGHRAPRLQAALWGLVFLRLILPVDLASPWSVRSWIARLAQDASPPAAMAAEGARHALSPTPLGDLAASAKSSGPPGFWFGLWLCGAVGSAAGAWRHRRRFRRWVLRSSPVSDEGLLAATERWRRVLRIRRSVRLVESSQAPTAFTLGVLRPVVVLPREMIRGWAIEAVEAVLAHELAHIRRFDDLRGSLEGWLRNLFFFHPLVRVAARRSSQCRELLCDELALAQGRLDRRGYGRALIDALRVQRPALGTATLSTFSNTKGTHKMRLLAILRHQAPSTPKLLGYRALALAASLLVLPLAPYQAEVSEGLVSTAMGAPELLAPEMINPLPGGRITSAFGPQKDPFDGKDRFHQGIDLGAQSGTPVLAPAPGRVVIARNEPKGRESFGM
ncbi:MAG: M48 family metalloprotease, partial [Acidobacteria bacterium]|nr:M48 family metalloprotease [Acidobacteriota bacterium]